MARYPKKGKGSKWIQKELLAIPADWKGETISDGDGLLGEVRVSRSGEVSVRFKYGMKWHGKKTWFSCGSFPTNDIGVIRANRDSAKVLLKGIDPRIKKQADRIEAQAEQAAIVEQEKEKQRRNRSFADLFATWLEQGVAREDGNAELKRTFEKDVLPVIGYKLVKEIDEEDIRAVYKGILARGTVQNPRERTVVKLDADIRQLFKWADERQPWRGLIVNGEW